MTTETKERKPRTLKGNQIRKEQIQREAAGVKPPRVETITVRNA